MTVQIIFQSKKEVNVEFLKKINAEEEVEEDEKVEEIINRTKELLSMRENASLDFRLLQILERLLRENNIRKTINRAQLSMKYDKLNALCQKMY